MHQLHIKQCPNTLLYQQITKKNPFFQRGTHGISCLFKRYKELKRNQLHAFGFCMGLERKV